MEFDTSAPIWAQLVTEFSRRIVVSEWPAGSKIAGVRELAGQLGVNPNTAQRALSELERQGLCHSERTSGRFVTTDQTRIDQLRADLTEETADAFISRARGFGMGPAQAQQIINQRWDHHDNPHNDSTTVQEG